MTKKTGYLVMNLIKKNYTKDEIIAWATSFNITHSALRELFGIWNQVIPNRQLNKTLPNTRLLQCCTFMRYMTAKLFSAAHTHIIGQRFCITVLNYAMCNSVAG